jgi:hypothetical protein
MNYHSRLSTGFRFATALTEIDSGGSITATAPLRSPGGRLRGERTLAGGMPSAPDRRLNSRLMKSLSRSIIVSS